MNIHATDFILRMYHINTKPNYAYPTNRGYIHAPRLGVWVQVGGR